MPDNISDKIADAITARALLAERFKSFVWREIRKRMVELHGRLIELHARADIAGIRTAFQERRRRALFEQVKLTMNSGYEDFRKQHALRIRQLAETESTFALKVVNQAVGVDIATVALSAEQITSVTSRSLIFGAQSRDWWSRQKLQFRRKFEDRVRSGILQGLTTDEITRTIRGTRSAKFADGIMKGTTRQAEALVRTSVQNAANEARLKTFANNEDIIEGIEWISTLDTRTTKICMALDGKVWKAESLEPIGHNKVFPGPTAHWNCRSTQIAVLKSFDEINKGRKAPDGKKFDTFFEEELRKQGMSEEQIAAARANTRASMDGQVTENTDFQSWFSRQSKARKNELLGPERVKMFEEGKISIDQLTDQRNRPLSIEELQKL